MSNGCVNSWFLRFSSDVDFSSYLVHHMVGNLIYYKEVTLCCHTNKMLRKPAIQKV